MKPINEIILEHESEAIIDSTQEDEVMFVPFENTPCGCLGNGSKG
jgi:hypothetical protein